MHSKFRTRTYLRNMLGKNAYETADVTSVIEHGPHGANYRAVQKSLDCPETELQGAGNPGVSLVSGTRAPFFRDRGAPTGLVFASPPPGRAGVAVPQGDELTFDLTPPPPLQLLGIGYVGGGATSSNFRVVTIDSKTGVQTELYAALTIPDSNVVDDPELGGSATFPKLGATDPYNLAVLSGDLTFPDGSFVFTAGSGLSGGVELIYIVNVLTGVVTELFDGISGGAHGFGSDLFIISGSVSWDPVDLVVRFSFRQDGELTTGFITVDTSGSIVSSDNFEALTTPQDAGPRQAFAADLQTNEFWYTHYLAPAVTPLDDQEIHEFIIGDEDFGEVRTTSLGTLDGERQLPMAGGITATDGFVIDAEADLHGAGRDGVSMDLVTKLGAGDFTSLGWTAAAPLEWAPFADEKRDISAHIAVVSGVERHVVFPVLVTFDAGPDPDVEAVAWPAVVVFDVGTTPAATDPVTIDETPGKIAALAPLPAGFVGPS